MNYQKIKIKKLKVDDVIITSNRLRGADPKKVEKIKNSIAKIGLINPISVSGTTLTAGLHRLLALKELGIEEADFIEIGSDELIVNEVEIDENLCRSELTILERSRFEAVKKKNKDEWEKRQLPIQFLDACELAKIDEIDEKAKGNIKGTVYENDKDFLLELTRLPFEMQVYVTSSLSVKGVEDYIKQKIGQDKKEKYPDKDKNQIKFQIGDLHMDLANKFIKSYRIRSIPELARNLLEMYLNSFYREERIPDDEDFVELFEELTDVGKDDFQDTKRGGSI